MPRSNLLLIDFNNLLYRAVFANRKLSHRGEFTGGIYGWINSITKAVRRYDIDKLVVCKDEKPYFRLACFPEYKANRGSSLDEDALAQIATARAQINQFLDQVQCPVAKHKGHEADDFIGRVCKGKATRFKSVFIISNDSDFFQFFVQPNVFLITRNGLYGLADFLDDYDGLDPEHWPLVTALMGSHNGVPGIRGVGEKTAVRLVRKYGPLKVIDYVEGKYDHPADEIKKRRRLATFPYPLAPRPILPRVGPIKYDQNEFEKQVCDKHGIRFTSEMHDAFRSLSRAR